MSEMEILREILASIVPVSALLGFVSGTALTLFAWMVRQPYRVFRKIVGV